jgi:hypothetical protein
MFASAAAACSAEKSGGRGFSDGKRSVTIAINSLNETI